MKKSALFFHVSDVCMLRLDFETFTTVGTNGSANDNEGDCVDQFAVTVKKTTLTNIRLLKNTDSTNSRLQLDK